ncbi:MAG: glutamate formimidoyltransferase [bacterium]|jgi:glutamate formiminotransferase/formiminotetrahydrofolate cyclodeaminase|nr:glutamate formimidoyltransferase [candidate division KSB1 bacterium]MDH7560565.1 glutamate formimidoyltransferase [bacterium]
MQQLVECVPNFSEGRNGAVIDAITREIADTEGVKLLDVDPGADTNRTVVTFVGTPAGVVEAAFKAIRRAAELIDMSKHRGAHPRIGATDVCPFVPLAGCTMGDCVALARQLGARVGEELGIPVYLYEEAATRPERKNLADIRQGEYEGLPAKLKDPAWAPDFGPAVFNPKTGATVIGAREFLIAYNINLNTRDRRLAQEIALNIRESGRLQRDAEGNILRDEQGNALRKPGKFQAVKAVGWYIPEYKQAQVSINLVNYKVTPPHVVFDEVCREAELLGLRVTGSELVGLIPLEALLMAGRYYLEKQGRSSGLPERDLVDIAVRSLGLNDISHFEPERKIIEYQMGERRGPLVRMGVADFVDELSTESPAPGGGSVAALAGALAAALAAMVANLSVGKKGYEGVASELKEVATRAQELKDALLAAVDEDTRAFNRVMDAFALPKNTEEQKQARQAAIQEATRGATQVPLQVMQHAVQALELAAPVAEKGMSSAASDAGVSALMARAAVEAAALNVRINLGSLEDQEFVATSRASAEHLVTVARSLAERVLSAVEGKLS